jgi:4-alpha-glucanotransferase
MLQDLAARYAIQTEYEGIDGTMHHPPEATLERLLAAFGVAAGDEPALRASLDVAPARAAPEWQPEGARRCYLPGWLEDGRAWGVSAQLYQLRSARDWGIGDFADLAALARIAGAEGADFLGVNPLHAPLLAAPERCSPFSPSNRRFLNPLYIAVDRLAGFEPASVDAEDLEAARAGDLVDYAAVARLKLRALRRLWAAGHRDEAALARFRAAGGASLERHARFEAISAQMAAEGHGAGWDGWPEAWRDPDGAAVADFAREREDDVAFHAWLQFLADRQLGEARDAALEAGMRIGLYLDFAVGEVPDGSGTWAEREVTVPGIRIGAPPDYFAVSGQDWALAPLSPVTVAATEAATFRRLMEDATRRAGALRIDHAMALWQLFMIPEGATPAEGTYVRFPANRMLDALAEASHLNRTIVIGEDLGNVPRGFREAMDATAILSYRILLFERDEQGFIPPGRYPRNALVCLSTHDLPTFQGWWEGGDVTLRAQFGLIGAEAAQEQGAARGAERAQLLADLADAGLVEVDSAALDQGGAASEAVVVAVHQHLARAPSRLFAVRLDDVAGERQPVNLPGTVDEYPNWRRRLGLTLEELGGTPLWRDIAGALRAERPRGQA